MHAPRSLFCVALALSSMPGVTGALGEPQGPADASRPRTSVRGTLLEVDHMANSITMKSDDGKTLAWRVDNDVAREVEGFDVGVPLIVIYRDLPGDVKRVTALAFPGAEKTPTYVNMTGERVVLRSAPPVDGGCDAHASSNAEASVSVIPAGGRAEVLEACWCCAIVGETCNTTTRSGVGRAYLMQCF